MIIIVVGNNNIFHDNIGFEKRGRGINVWRFEIVVRLILILL